MEKKGAGDFTPTNFAPTTTSLVTLLNRAATGDKEASEELLRFFETDIQQMARFIRMPREDAVQTIMLEFLETIQKGEIVVNKQVVMLRAVQYYHMLIRSYPHFEEDFENPPYDELLAQLLRLKHRYQELYGEDPCSNDRC